MALSFFHGGQGLWISHLRTEYRARVRELKRKLPATETLFERMDIELLLEQTRRHYEAELDRAADAIH